MKTQPVVAGTRPAVKKNALNTAFFIDLYVKGKHHAYLQDCKRNSKLIANEFFLAFDYIIDSHIKENQLTMESEEMAIVLQAHYDKAIKNITGKAEKLIKEADKKKEIQQRAMQKLKQIEEQQRNSSEVGRRMRSAYKKKFAGGGHRRRGYADSLFG